MVIEICIGSSCHLKGSRELVDLFTNEIERRNLKDKIILKGSFCKEKCNRDGIQCAELLYPGQPAPCALNCRTGRYQRCEELPERR